MVDETLYVLWWILAGSCCSYHSGQKPHLSAWRNIPRKDCCWVFARTRNTNSAIASWLSKSFNHRRHEESSRPTHARSLQRTSCYLKVYRPRFIEQWIQMHQLLINELSGSMPRFLSERVTGKHDLGSCYNLYLTTVFQQIIFSHFPHADHPLLYAIFYSKEWSTCICRLDQFYKI